MSNVEESISEIVNEIIAEQSEEKNSDGDKIFNHPQSPRLQDFLAKVLI